METWVCYLLQSQSGRTYVGVTKDLQRRVRQHNRQQTGGARATGVDSGWLPVCHVLGFPDMRAALQFEWKWKNLTRTAAGSTPLLRRLSALETLLSSEKTTATATPFASYPAPLLLECSATAVSEYFANKALPYAVVNEGH